MELLPRARDSNFDVGQRLSSPQTSFYLKSVNLVIFFWLKITNVSIRLEYVRGRSYFRLSTSLNSLSDNREFYFGKQSGPCVRHKACCLHDRASALHLLPTNSVYLASNCVCTVISNFLQLFLRPTKMAAPTMRLRPDSQDGDCFPFVQSATKKKSELFNNSKIDPYVFLPWAGEESLEPRNQAGKPPSLWTNKTSLSPNAEESGSNFWWDAGCVDMHPLSSTDHIQLTLRYLC